MRLLRTLVEERLEANGDEAHPAAVSAFGSGLQLQLKVQRRLQDGSPSLRLSALLNSVCMFVCLFAASQLLNV